MKIRQLSLFIENKPGHLRAACRLLADAGIDIKTMALADTEQFGILRFIVKNWQKALQVFKNAGLVVKESDLIAVMVDDRPGGLADLLDSIDQANLNVEYMYGFSSRIQGKAVMLFRFNDLDSALRVLQENQVAILSDEDLFHN
ncbi:MAG: hypothetical protein FWC50_07860 [Planctomycetaceae bacterium]|nr:hypothetical protein [Planctomycetaceae bacterium]